jgi:hypothetical protein
MVLAAALDKENVKAGVVLDVATDVLNKGVRLPAVKLVTVPLPPPPPVALIVTAPVPPDGLMVTLVPAMIWDTPDVNDVGK